MHRKLIQKVVVAAALCLVCSSRSMAEVILPNLPPGSSFQIVFVTRGTDNAYDTNFNSFVRSQAAGNPSLPQTSWWGVASSGQTAQSNARVYDDIPIYNTAGQLVAANGQQFYSSSHVSSIGYDQYGDARLAEVWTGMSPQGAPLSQLTLGPSPAAGYGVSTASDGRWAQADWSSNNMESRSFYGLSEPIVAVPEPSALLLSVVGLSGAAVFRHRKRTG